MFALRIRSIWPFVALCHQPWPTSLASASRLSLSQPIEEEKTPYYHPDHFYPARLGQVLDERYQVVTKLGYGSNSTVWLARDLHRWRWSSERYVAVKINTNSHHSRENAAENELAILRNVSQVNSTHEGRHFVRKLVDHFTIDDACKKHSCFVFEPLREPWYIYRRRFVGRVIPSEILKIQVQMLLQGLDYLHSECQVIHTDLKLDNIMVKIEDLSILDRDARNEHDYPLPQKHADGRIIYLSRNNYGKFSVPTGVVQITDFDLSVLGNIPHTGCIQADSYRAPEVVLDVGYTYSVDIWSLGVLLWDVLEGRRLFEVIDPNKVEEYDDQTHLARITALLGSPPRNLLSNGGRTSMFYKSDGNLKDPDLMPKDFSFETTINNIDGEEKKMFIQFVKRMIKWSPEERSTAKELLDDPWLHTDFSQD